MRKLNTADVFATMRFISKLGVKDEIKGIMAQYDKEKDKSTTEIGFDAIMRLFEIAASQKAEKELYALLAGPFECDAAAVENMPLDDLVGGFMEIAEGGHLKAFFHSVYKLLTRKQEM